MHRRRHVKITLLSDDAIRLERTDGGLVIEALSADQAYSPFHMLASSLAFCTFSVLHAWGSQAGIAANDLTIDVHWTFADNPHRVDSIGLSFNWPSMPAKRIDAARRAAELCTIHATLSHPPTITVAGVAGDEVIRKSA